MVDEFEDLMEEDSYEKEAYDDEYQEEFANGLSNIDDPSERERVTLHHNQTAHKLSSDGTQDAKRNLAKSIRDAGSGFDEASEHFIKYQARRDGMSIEQARMKARATLSRPRGTRSVWEGPD